MFDWKKSATLMLRILEFWIVKNIYLQLSEFPIYPILHQSPFLQTILHRHPILHRVFEFLKMCKIGCIQSCTGFWVSENVQNFISAFKKSGSSIHIRNNSRILFLLRGYKVQSGAITPNMVFLDQVTGPHSPGGLYKPLLCLVIWFSLPKLPINYRIFRSFTTFCEMWINCKMWVWTASEISYGEIRRFFWGCNAWGA